MTEPQVWVLIGVFAAIMLGGFTMSTTLINRAMRSGFEAVDARFEAVDARFETLEVKLRAEISASEHRLSAKIAALDSDVQGIARQVFGNDRP